MDEGVDENYEKRIDEAEEKPDLDIFDRGGGGEALRDGDVDGGEDHHAGDVNRNDVTKELVSNKEAGGLVDDVHEDCREVGHQDDVTDLPTKMNFYLQSFLVIVKNFLGELDILADDNVLTNFSQI